MSGSDQVIGQCLLKVKNAECHSEGPGPWLPTKQALLLLEAEKEGCAAVLTWARGSWKESAMHRCPGELPVLPAGLVLPRQPLHTPPGRNNPRRSASPHTQATTAATIRHGALIIPQTKSTEPDLFSLK